MRDFVVSISGSNENAAQAIRYWGRSKILRSVKLQSVPVNINPPITCVGAFILNRF